MQQSFLHKVKLVALIEAAIALIGMFLAWTVESYPAQMVNQQQGQFGQFDQGQFGQAANQMTSSTLNGFNSWGWLALIGILVVVVVTLAMGNRQYDYDRNSRMIVMAGFILIAAAALIYYFRLTSVAKDYVQLMQQRGIQYSATSGMGLWSVLAAGVLGALWVSGVLGKLNTQPVQGGYSQQYPPQQYPPQQYPPQQYPPQQYPPQQYPPQYSQQQPPYPPQQGNYPPQQPNYPGYPPQQQQQPYPPQPTHGQGHPDTPPPPPPPPSNPYV